MFAMAADWWRGGSKDKDTTDPADEDDGEVEEDAEIKTWTDLYESKTPLPWFPPTVLKRFSDTVQENCWSEPDARCFKVRGPNYLTDRIKVDSAPAPYRLVGVDLFTSDERLENLSSRRDSWIAALHKEYERRKEPVPFVFLINFIMPWGHFITYWSSCTPSPYVGDAKWDALMKAFLEKDDEFRNLRFKFVPRMIEGNWAVKKTMGENKPAIIGQKLRHVYHRTKNYLEVGCDICSSKIARGILSMVQTWTNKVVIDLVFMLEPQRPEELPERVLSCIRFHYLNPDIAPKLPTLPAAHHPAWPPSSVSPERLYPVPATDSSSSSQKAGEATPAK